MPRTIDDVQHDMSALVSGADGRALTQDECNRYEELEQELNETRRSDQIRARNAAYGAAAPLPDLPPIDPAGGGSINDAAYSREFRQYLRTGQATAGLQPGPGVNPSNAQSEGVPSEGGYLVPTGFRVKLEEALKSYGGLATVVDSYTTGTGNPVQWPTINDTANVGEVVQENGTFVGGADLVFGERTLRAYSYASSGTSGTPVRLSWELIQDSAFDIEGLAARLLGDRIRRIQAVHWVRGTGIEQPLGIVTGRTPVQTAANTGITYDDIVDWIHSVDPAYRDNGRWAFNDGALKVIRKIKDSHGDPIYRGWGADLESGFGAQPRLLGYPVTIDQAFADYDADDSTDLFGVFGDLRRGYVIRTVRDVQVVANPWTRANYRQTEVTAWARADGTQQDTTAYSVLSGKS